MNYLNGITGIEIWALWLALAIGLLIIEVLVTVGFFVSFSASAAIIAIEVYVLGPNDSYHDLWHWLGFTVLGVVLYFPIRMLLKKFSDKTKDISDY